MVSSALKLSPVLFPPRVLSCPIATFQLFRYFQEVTKKNGGTACSSRGSYEARFFRWYFFSLGSREFNGRGPRSIRQRCAERFRRNGGKEGNDGERSADKAEVSRPRDNCQRKRDKTFSIPSSSLSPCPMNAVETYHRDKREKNSVAIRWLVGKRVDIIADDQYHFKWYFTNFESGIRNYINLALCLFLA